MKKIIILFVIMFTTTANAAFTTRAKSALLIDYDSGTEIFAKNADELMPPSSMVKLMTLTLLFDAVKSGDLKMEDRLPVGPNADYNDPKWYTASKICLVSGQDISIRDLILGLIVLSGGDASVVVAEKLAGSEEAFTNMMQKKARDIGMPRSTFGNASGLPHPNNLMTSRELATLAMHIIDTHPDLYPMFATKRFEFTEHKTDWCREWGRTHTINYNKLLFIMSGADGMKTGHTSDGGYGMVASSKIGGRRLIAVVNGLRAPNHNALAEEVKKLLNYGYSATVNKTFYQANDKIVEIPVWYGRRPTVTATVAKTFAATFDKNQSTTGLRVVARYNEPVRAPVRAGDEVGEVIASQDGVTIARAPLIAAERVSKTQFFGRVFRNLKYIFTGK